MDADNYFCDFELRDYLFVVVNKHDKQPLTWEFKDTYKVGTLYYGKNKQIVMRDPYDLARELNAYQNCNYLHPIGVKEDEPNDIIEWLNKQ